jgi:hypothetical protein
MPNKVAAYYTTDEPYRNVGSNHIVAAKYNAASKVLYVKFYNGAEYEYYGIEQGLYDGMMASPSHGVFFWANIRQRYPYKLLGSDSSKNKPKPIPGQGASYKAVPELAKLDKLDQQEFALNISVISSLKN